MRQKIIYKEGCVQTDDNQTDWNTYEPQPSTLINVPILEFTLLVQPGVEIRPPKIPPRPTRLVDWQQSKLFQNITCTSKRLPRTQCEYLLTLANKGQLKEESVADQVRATIDCLTDMMLVPLKHVVVYTLEDDLIRLLIRCL